MLHFKLWSLGVHCSYTETMTFFILILYSAVVLNSLVSVGGGCSVMFRKIFLCKLPCSLQIGVLLFLP